MSYILPDNSFNRRIPARFKIVIWRYTHPEFDSEIITALSGTENLARMIIEEHEHYDGTGYPKGLKGDEICLGAQIVAVADAFDVLVSKRPYKEPYLPDDAISSGLLRPFRARNDKIRQKRGFFNGFNLDFLLCGIEGWSICYGLSQTIQTCLGFFPK